MRSNIIPFPAKNAKRKVQAVDLQRPDPPVTPSPHRFIPREVRRTVAYAFTVLYKSVTWLAKTNRLTEFEVQCIIREEHANAIELARREAAIEAERKAAKSSQRFPAVMFPYQRRTA